MNHWQNECFKKLHANSKLLLLHIDQNKDSNGIFEISMSCLRIALNPLTDMEIKAAVKEIESLLNISSDKKKVSVKASYCVDVKKPKPASKRSKQSLLMRDSLQINIDMVKMAFFGTMYEKANIEFYYECALAWSDSKGETSKDWVATIRNFILRDFKAGKMVTGSINQDQKINGIAQAIANWDDI